MEHTITNHKGQEFSIMAYPSNISIFSDEGSIALINCTGDEPVIINGEKYTDGRDLAMNIDTMRRLNAIIKQYS